MASQISPDSYALDQRVAQTAGVQGLLPVLRQAATELKAQAEGRNLPAHAGEAALALAMVDHMSAQLPVALYKLANVAAAVSPTGSQGASAAYYNAMREVVAHARPDLSSTAPVWTGAPAAGQTLLVHCTNGQGFGDTFMFGGLLAPLLRSGAVDHVVYEVQKPLKALFRQLANDTGKPITVIARGEELPAHDLVIPNMNLHGAMGLNLQTYYAPRNFIQAPQVVDADLKEWVETEVIAAQKQGKVVICMAWQGDKGNIALEPARSCHIDNLVPLLKNENVKVISVQAGYGSEQLDQLAPDVRARVSVFPDKFDKAAGAFYATSYLMSKVDRVVSTDTATAHIAGAVGADTIVMLPQVAELRWPTAVLDPRTRVHATGAAITPHNYYSQMTLVTQAVQGQWGPVVQAVNELLNDQHRQKVQPAPARAAGPRAPSAA